MKIPNSKHAYLDIEKLTNYCLNDQHPRGKHKAKVFRAALGLTANDAVFLQYQLLEAVRKYDAQFLGQDQYGKRYIIDFSIQFKIKRQKSVVVG